MTPKTVLTTCGVSLWSNFGKSNSRPAQGAHELARYLRQCERQGALKDASAETHSLAYLLHPGDALVLVHSPTGEGRECAEALAIFYQDKCAEVSRREVRGLEESPKEMRTAGLRNLIAALTEEIEKAEKRSTAPVINATGGFKAMVVYATVVGMLFGVPVYYVFESFEHKIDLVPLPLDWNLDFVAEHREFFEWIADDWKPASEVERRLQAYGEAAKQVRMLLEDSNGHFALSAFGQAVWNRWRQFELTPPPPPRRRKPKVSLGKDHHAPRGLESFAGRLAAENCFVTQVTHKSECRPQPTRVLRSEADGSVYLRYSDGGSAVVLRVQTTAKGATQSRKAQALLEEWLRAR